MTSANGHIELRMCPSRSALSNRAPSGMNNRCEIGDRCPSLSIGDVSPPKSNAAYTSPKRSAQRQRVSSFEKATQPIFLWCSHERSKAHDGSDHARMSLSSLPVRSTSPA
eukprot:862629-Pleurochrysis_carterae.AAC.2